MTDFNNSKTKELFQAFAQLGSADEAANFCRDLMTEAEIAEFSGRWLVARALAAGKSQRVVAKETGVSIATVTRVNQWLNRGMGGYKNMISKLSPTVTSVNHHSSKTLISHG